MLIGHDFSVIVEDDLPGLPGLPDLPNFQINTSADMMAAIEYTQAALDNLVTVTASGDFATARDIIASASVIIPIGIAASLSFKDDIALAAWKSLSEVQSVYAAKIPASKSANMLSAIKETHIVIDKISATKDLETARSLAASVASIIPAGISASRALNDDVALVSWKSLAAVHSAYTLKLKN